MTGVAAAADLALSPGLGLPFLALFVATCGWASAHATRAALFAAATVPPLAYLVAVLLAVAAGRGAPSGGGAWPQLLATMGAGAPAAYAATAVGTGLALARRGLAGRERPRTAPAGPPAGPGAARAAARR